MSPHFVEPKLPGKRTDGVVYLRFLKGRHDAKQVACASTSRAHVTGKTGDAKYRKVELNLTWRKGHREDIWNTTQGDNLLCLAVFFERDTRARTMLGRGVKYENIHNPRTL